MAAMFSVGRFSGSGVLRLSLHVERTGLHFTPKRCKASRLTSHLKRFKHTAVCPLPLTIKNSRMPIFNEHFSMQICSRSFNSGSNTQRKVLSSAAALNLPSIKQIEQFLNSKGMPYEHGHTSIVVGCLHCEKEKGKTAEKSMFVNKTTGSHFCRSCGSSGSWRQFKAMHSDQNSSKPTSTSTQPEYNEPVTMSSSDSDEKAKDLWNISLLLKDATDTVRNRILESFKIEKLTEEMLTKYQVHVAEYKFSEPTGKSCAHACVVFPWYNPSKSTVHGVKLERVEQDAKELVTLQPRLGTLGLFGWNTITPEAKEVVLALNEFDAIAVHQATSCPAISLPLGTHSLPPEVLPQLEQFERIILWFGEDVRARQAAIQFSKKLSIQRCHIVRPPGDSPPSGPLDALNKGFDLNELVTSSKPISHEKIATFQELRADVYSELVNADQVSGVKWSRFPKLNSLLKGHRRGELTIFTGPTGAGKTTLLSEMSVDLCQQGVNTLWGSFEIRNVRLAKIMMNQFSGVDLSKNVQLFNYWADKFEMLPMYFMCFYGSQNISTVIETMAHAVYVFDIDHVVIDNLQFMTSSLRAEDRFSVQNQAISSLRDFASSKNVHVTLVIHPRKENDDVELQTASIFGTAKASQEADNVLILQDKKGRGEKYLQITKNRFDGSVGRVPLEFVKGSLSMCGFGKKDSTTTNNNNKMQNTFKPSKKISDIDMINIPSGLPIQKARLKPYSPVFLKSDSANPEAVQGQRSKHSPTVFQKADKATPEEVNVHKSKISPPGFSKSEKGNQGGARLSFSSKDVESVRTFQENLSESIRSRGLGQKSPASSPSKVVGDAQKLDAKKLYSKTVASLVAKHVIKNRIQQKKVTSLGRLKPAIKTNK